MRFVTLVSVAAVSWNASAGAWESACGVALLYLALRVGFAAGFRRTAPTDPDEWAVRERNWDAEFASLLAARLYDQERDDGYLD